MFGIFKVTKRFGEKEETPMRMTRNGRELSFSTKKVALDTIVEFQTQCNVRDNTFLVARVI